MNLINRLRIKWVKHNFHSNKTGIYLNLSYAKQNLPVYKLLNNCYMDL